MRYTIFMTVMKRGGTWKEEVKGMGKGGGGEEGLRAEGGKRVPTVR